MHTNKKQNNSRRIKYIIFGGLVIGVPIAAAAWLLQNSFWNQANLLSIIGLVLSVYSLIATVLISWTIYKFQKNDMDMSDDRRIKKAKALVSAELENALENFLFISKDCCLPGTCSGTKDIVYKYLADIQDYLEPDLFTHLLRIVNLIDAKINADMEDFSECRQLQDATTELLLRPWLFEIMNSKYRGYYPIVSNYQDLLNEQTFKLVNTLRGISKEYESNINIIRDKFGHPLFEKRSDQNVRIYNGDGLLIAEGSFGLNDLGDLCIVDGYEKSNKYDGHYKNGKYDGQGTLHNNRGYKLKEGLWKEGELVSGIEFDWICKKEMDDYKPCIQFGADFMLSTITPYIEHEGLDEYYVVDFHVDGDTEDLFNIRPLEKYLKEHAPSKLESLLFRIGLYQDESNLEEQEESDDLILSKSNKLEEDEFPVDEE